VDYGDWQLGQRRTHGQQFKARFLKTSVPTSVDGIERYLASGMIRGIGPARIAWAQAYPTRPVHIIVGFHGDRQGSRYGNGFASQKCGGAKVTIRSLLLCGDRDIDIHRLRDWHGLAIASGPQALKLVKRFVETSLKSDFVTGKLTKCITLFRVGIERASEEDFFPVAFTSGAI
jgi:hypothetical protein